MRVSGRDDEERRVPLPEAFSPMFGLWLKDQSRGEFAFARAPRQKPVSCRASRIERRGMLKKAGIAQKVNPRCYSAASETSCSGLPTIDSQPALPAHESQSRCRRPTVDVATVPLSTIFVVHAENKNIYHRFTQLMWN